MTYLHWTKGMSVGVPALDTDHRCLIRIINLLDSVTEADADRVVDMVLDTLLIYGRFHFAREERVMEACRFPSLSFHRGEHAGFVHAIKALKDQYRHDVTTDMVAELQEYLSGWLYHHVLIQDMAIKPYIANVDAEVFDDLARAAAPEVQFGACSSQESPRMRLAG